jgi:hypothetical protein
MQWPVEIRRTLNVDEAEKLLIETISRSKSNQRRIDELEKKVDTIQELTISVI